MEEIITFILLVLGLGLLEKLLARGRRPEPGDAEVEYSEPDYDTEPDYARARPAEWAPEEGPAAPSPHGAGTLEELIAEQLGISMERRPRVRPRPQVVRPRPEAAEPEPEPSWRAPTYRGEISTEAIASEEIGSRPEAASLEEPRRPDAHERFHDRYEIPEPVATHEEFHRRYVRPLEGPARRPGRGARLPDRHEWTPVQKAVVWSELLGRPRGLEGLDG